MKKRKQKRYDDDDGRVIAPMNVSGMPWSIDGEDASAVKGKCPLAAFMSYDGRF